jgi:hypothetical protein
VSARAANAKGAVLQQRTAGGAWRTVRTVPGGGTSMSLTLRANTDFRVTLPGTSGTSVSVDVAPRLQVQALSARLLGGKVLPRPSVPVQVWRMEQGQWRVVARPILDENGEFRTPLPLRPVDYKITVAADGTLASARTWLHVTRRLLSTLDH